MSTLLKWQNLGRLASVMLLALFLGCIGGGHGHNPQGSLQVDNNGGVNMTQLFVTPSSSPTWGVDQLSADVTPGHSIILTRIFPDFYDVQARFADGSRDEVFDVPINDGLTTLLSVANSGTGTVAVFNNSAGAINEINLTPTTSTTWGPNQLDAALLGGDTLNLTAVAPGAYDLRVVFANGNIVLPPSFTVIAGSTITITVP